MIRISTPQLLCASVNKVNPAVYASDCYDDDWFVGMFAVSRRVCISDVYVDRLFDFCIIEIYGSDRGHYCFLFLKVDDVGINTYNA